MSRFELPVLVLAPRAQRPRKPWATLFIDGYSRLITGWAYNRGLRRPTHRHWTSRTAARLGMLPMVAFYVLVVFFTQYTAWHGAWSLYEQHAFLLPVPFFNW